MTGLLMADNMIRHEGCSAVAVVAGISFTDSNLSNN